MKGPPKKTWNFLEILKEESGGKEREDEFDDDKDSLAG